LRLYGKDGRPLPGDPVGLIVQSIQFGSTLLIIIFAALGVLVLTAIARAIRRSLRDAPGTPGDGGPGNAPASAPDGGTADSPGQVPDGGDEAKRSPAMPSEAGRDATVEAGNETTESRYPPEVPDDHARARDWARYT
jgi:hypothetical protein